MNLGLLLEHMQIEYLNIMAEVELGKNLEIHYSAIVDTLEHIRGLIIKAQQQNEENAAALFKELEYGFCLLKDDVVKAINNTH